MPTSLLFYLKKVYFVYNQLSTRKHKSPFDNLLVHYLFAEKVFFSLNIDQNLKCYIIKEILFQEHICFFFIRNSFVRSINKN